MSASSISRQILKLEHSFGTPLLLRHAQGVRLTAAGEAVARFTNNRSHEMQRLKASINALKNLERGHVSIHTVEGSVGGLLPRALSAFSGRFPGITYEVQVAGTDDVIAAVVDDRCDIGITFHPYPHPDVQTMASIRQSLLGVVAPSHPLSERSLLEIADIAQVPVAVPDRSFGIRHLVDHVVKTEQIELNVRLETNSIEMIRQFALHGMGMCFLPAFAFERDISYGSLVGLPIMTSALSASTTQICKRSGVELALPAAKFMETLIGTADQTSVAFNATQRAAISASSRDELRTHSPSARPSAKGT